MGVHTRKQPGTQIAAFYAARTLERAEQAVNCTVVIPMLASTIRLAFPIDGMQECEHAYMHIHTLAPVFVFVECRFERNRVSLPRSP